MAQRMAAGIQRPPAKSDEWPLNQSKQSVKSVVSGIPPVIEHNNHHNSSLLTPATVILWLSPQQGWGFTDDDDQGNNAVGIVLSGILAGWPLLGHAFRNCQSSRSERHSNRFRSLRQ